jgi:hypothetical protein
VLTVQELARESNDLFQKAAPMRTLWQEMALNFYPERADFTVDFTTGKELASHLFTGSPVLARRELSNIFSMQRPQGQQWFAQVPKFDVDRKRIDQEGLEFLDYANQVQYKAIYHKSSGFNRATREGDDSFAAFGQTVISVEYDMKLNSLLFRNWHIRDVVWTDDNNGRISRVYCKRKFTIGEMKKIFKKIPPHLANTKDCGQKYTVIHAVIPSEDFFGDDRKDTNLPFIQVYFTNDEGGFELSKSGSITRKYVIPRWLTVSGSQYAYSPSTVVALSDARMLQEMYETLLEAGEMSLKPAMIGVEDAIKSELELYPGGFTSIDAAYDERLGEVLRPITQDRSGIPYGMEMIREVEARLGRSFYLDKIGLPQLGKEMTAFEVSQRVSQYVREATPLFQPYEMEYNGELMDMTFETLMNVGSFGSLNEIPESVRGLETSFVFESVLQGARDQQKSQKFLETKAIIAEASQMDPSAASLFKVKVATRDVITGIGTPAVWIASEEELEQEVQARQDMEMQQQLMAGLQQGGIAAEQIGKGAQAMQDSGLL